MDFEVGLPLTQKSYDSIQVVVDRLSTSTLFIPVKSSYSANDYAKIFLDEILCRHGSHLSIIPDRGAHFTSRVWRLFKNGLGTMVKLSTAFHPQTDGQAGHTIQTLEYILRVCIIGFKRSWDKHLPLLQFAYKYSFHDPFPWLSMMFWIKLQIRKSRS